MAMCANASRYRRACPRRAAPDFSNTTNMLLYLAMLIAKLCFCEGVTSIEIFDLFDENIDLEMPAMDTVGKDIMARREVEGIANATTCIGNAECTDGSVHNEYINDNITKTIQSLKLISANNTNMMHNNETMENKGSGEQQNMLNNSSLETPIRTTKYIESVTMPSLTIPPIPFSCPEEEIPANIGPYEVPTQRDVVLHIRNHLLAMYHGFHAKAMYFLKDVKEATQASWSRKMLCQGPTELMHYRRCVRWVGDLSVLTTKSLVTALETARQHITTLMQGKICNISALSVDPIHLIRILAAEKVSLEFALPDFLRQLDACARHCPGTRLKLPHGSLNNAHLTDKNFVMRHYLTQQNFNQQLKQQYKI